MNTTSSPEIERYLAAVAARLADLPDAERDDLLEDLERHLQEVAAESAEPLEAQLGRPEDYAEELRASAGLGPTGRARLRARLLHHQQLDAGMAFLGELRPGRWVLRALLLVSALIGDWFVALLAATPAVAWSVGLGRRAAAPARWPRLLAAVVNIAAALATVAVIAQLRVSEATPPPGVAVDEGVLTNRFGEPITNLYPCDARGQPLAGVRVYDQDGEPVEILANETADGVPILTTYPTAPDGSALTNTFPQQQAEAARDDAAGHAAIRRPVSPCGR